MDALTRLAMMIDVLEAQGFAFDDADQLERFLDVDAPKLAKRRPKATILPPRPERPVGAPRMTPMPLSAPIAQVGIDTMPAPKGEVR